MLDAEVTDIGVAIAQSGKTGTYYAVQLFGRPYSTRIEFRVANASPAPIEYELNGKGFSLPPHATRMHQECRHAADDAPAGRAPVDLGQARGRRPLRGRARRVPVPAEEGGLVKRALPRRRAAALSR
jgi:hypothetical protein